MRVVIIKFLCLSTLMLALAVSGGAQQSPAAPNSNDPRVGLKPGLRDAGQAARNMELVASLPKPEGFFDPKAPGGIPTPPEQPERVRAVKSALDRADSVRTSGDKASAAAGEQLEALAKQFESDAGVAQGRDGARLKALAAALKGRAERLR